MRLRRKLKACFNLGMRKKDVIGHFGGLTATAKALGITPQAVYAWGEEVPHLRACQIELITSGSLKRKDETHELESRKESEAA